MSTLDPLISALAALCAAALMVQAGVAKRRLVWRPVVVRKRRTPFRRR